MSKAWMLRLTALLPIIVSQTTFAAAEGREAKEYLTDFTTIGNAVISFAMLIGLALVIFALLKFKKHSENPVQNTISSALLTFVSGLLLVSTRFLLDAFSNQLFGSSVIENGAGQGNYLSVGYTAESVYANSTTGSPINNATTIVFVGFAMLVGLFYFVKGIFLLHEMGGSGANSVQTRNKAIWHIVGGALAFNVTQFTCALSNTLGFSGFCL